MNESHYSQIVPKTVWTVIRFRQSVEDIESVGYYQAQIRR